MKKYISLYLVLILFCSCKNEIQTETIISSVEIETILEDSISIRAIWVGEKELWYAGNNGKYGAIQLENFQKFKGKIIKDSLALEFRSLAKTDSATFVLNVGNPAYLYKISNDKSHTQLVYTESHEKVFYDSMQFLDATFGIAMGDPIENCLNVIVTTDGGNSWSKIPCKNLPKTIEGEAAFAASNTNLIVRGNSIFMVSGGKKARCFVSTDKGNSWQVYETPIIQGEAMTGIFTADFYDENIGFIAGGNYENPSNNKQNKAITFDGGKTWKLVANGIGFGYASCVQFVPNSKGESLICVGKTGIHYSNDFGENWKLLDAMDDLYTVRFLNDSVAYAAGKNKIVELILKSKEAIK